MLFCEYRVLQKESQKNNGVEEGDEKRQDFLKISNSSVDESVKHKTLNWFHDLFLEDSTWARERGCVSILQLVKRSLISTAVYAYPISVNEVLLITDGMKLKNNNTYIYIHQAN